MVQNAFGYNELANRGRVQGELIRKCRSLDEDYTPESLTSIRAGCELL